MNGVSQDRCPAYILVTTKSHNIWRPVIAANTTNDVPPQAANVAYDAAIVSTDIYSPEYRIILMNYRNSMSQRQDLIIFKQGMLWLSLSLSRVTRNTFRLGKCTIVNQGSWVQETRLATVGRQLGTQDKSISECGSVLSICMEFLSNRRQWVVVDGATSECIPIVSGVPQGSILGPLLFILYTREMFKLMENRLYAYADDSTLLAVVGKPADRPAVGACLNRDMARIQE